MRRDPSWGCALGLLAMAACAKHATSESAPPLEETAWSPPVLAGVVTDGRFVDTRLGFSVPVPDGWRAAPATLNDATRVVFLDPTGVVRLRIAQLPAGVSGPEPRPDCDWAFEDVGTNAFPTLAAVNLATCVPKDADGPRILGWYAPGATPPLAFEVEAPPGRLLLAEDAMAAVLGGFSPPEPSPS